MLSAATRAAGRDATAAADRAKRALRVAFMAEFISSSLFFPTIYCSCASALLCATPPWAGLGGTATGITTPIGKPSFVHSAWTLYEHLLPVHLNDIADCLALSAFFTAMSEEKDTTAPPAAPSASPSTGEASAADSSVDLAKQNEQTVEQQNAINATIKATQVYI